MRAPTRTAGPVAALVLVALLVAGPALLGGPRRSGGAAGRTLVIVTPHNEQIRYEFSLAFAEWHRARHGEPARIVWTVPGGTGDILRLLAAQYTAALESAHPVGGAADLVMGGGTWAHGELKRPIEATCDGRPVSTTISVPAGFDPAWLQEVYGPNDIAGVPLYDPEQHWLGLALSSFGLVYNLDCLADLGLAEPDSWDDLAHPALRRWVALADPTQSGSIAAVYETILRQRGWDEGWRILRRMAANARSFSGGAPRAPIDVSLGQAAAAICIDFFGRYQAGSVAPGGAAGATGRVRYVDPAGETLVDPDPISMLRGAPDPELARRFIEFCLSVEGQALWQFRPRRAEDGRAGPAAPGPRRYELRRLPVRRVMYREHMDRFVDREDPYATARPPRHTDPGYRELVGPLFSALAIDTHDDLRRAWDAIVTHPAYPGGGRLVAAGDVADPELRRMLADFDAMPAAPGPDGRELSLDDGRNVPAAAEALRRPDLWPPEAEPAGEARARFARFGADRYRRIADHAAAGGARP